MRQAMHKGIFASLVVPSMDEHIVKSVCIFCSSRPFAITTEAIRLILNDSLLCFCPGLVPVQVHDTTHVECQDMVLLLREVRKFCLSMTKKIHPPVRHKSPTGSEMFLSGMWSQSAPE
jgi:hypothetical protein